MGDAYKRLRSGPDAGAGGPDVSHLARSASKWTRCKTGMGLPDEILADFGRLYDFEVRHPSDTWEQRSTGLLQDARSLCRALFPFYDEQDLQLEVDALLSSVSGRFSEGLSGSAKRADGARAQVSMVRGLLDWISF